jgi:hypothetical protein
MTRVLSTMMLGLVVAAGAVELLARWWLRFRSGYYVLPPGLRLEMHPDPEVLPQLERTVRFEVNSDGERGGEVPADGALYRILVAGGSQAEAFFLDQDTAWPVAIQRILERPEHLRDLGASHVHVGCIARSGVGSEAAGVILERTLPRYPRLQLIIVMVGATDVLRWLEQNTPQTLEAVRSEDLFRCHPHERLGWKPQQLAVTEWLRRARRRWLRPVDHHKGTGRWIAKARRMRALATTVYDTTPDPAPMIEHFEDHFRRVLQLASAHADRVLVVRQPWFSGSFTPLEAASMWHGGVGQAWKEEVTTYYSFDACTRLMQLVDAKAEMVAESLGIDALDLMPTMPQNLDTFYDCFHLTPAGSLFVARSVAAAILQRPRRRTASPVTPVPDRWLADEPSTLQPT